MDSNLTSMQQAVYSVLKREARLGRVCPSARVLADLCGTNYPQHAVDIMMALARKGLIHIHGDRDSRIVIILATGESTAMPMIDAPQPHTVTTPVTHGAMPCFRCGSRPDACMCGGGNG